MGFPATFPSMFVNAFSAATKINQTEGCHQEKHKIPKLQSKLCGKKDHGCFYVPGRIGVF